MKEILDKAEQSMHKRIDAFDHELASIRAGRANPAILDKVMVDYYGVPTKINQMAAVSVSEARMLVIQPWDVSTLKEIERAIHSANLGITPTNDGKVLRIVFPPLTEERRTEMVKEAHKLAEECKVSIRSVRRDANEKLKKMQKSSELTEDGLMDAEKKVQHITDTFCKQADDILKQKEKQIMEI